MDHENAAAADGGLFRVGVRAALQAAVDDLHQLVKRRQRAMANEAHTAVIVGIARRLATLPMPANPDDALTVMPRELLIAKAAQLLWPDLPWNDPNQVGEGPEGGMPVFVGQHAQMLQTAWLMAAEVVTLVRYA